MKKHFSLWLHLFGSRGTVTNASYNGLVSAGAAVSPSPGFNGSWIGSNTAPVAFTLNGQMCR